MRNDDSLDFKDTIIGPGNEPDGRLPDGCKFGPYRIVRFIGGGGMGKVYEVIHETLGLTYALKILHPELSGDSSFLSRFKVEARAMAQLRHDHIVKVDDFDDTDGRYWLRMELVKGLDLAPFGVTGRATTLSHLAWNMKGRVEQELLAEILGQVLDGLAYAHGRGAIHRDIKPANILLGQPEGSDRVHTRIADFGLVRLVGEDWFQSQAQLTIQRSMAQGIKLNANQPVADEGSSTQSMLGTIVYMSPEQKRCEVADKTSDVYSLGLVAFRLLTGLEDMAFKLPSQVDSTLVKAWDQWLVRALEPDPANRFPDAAAMLEAMKSVNSALSGTAQDAARAQREQQRAKDDLKRQAEVDAVRRRAEGTEKERLEAEAKRIAEALSAAQTLVQKRDYPNALARCREAERMAMQNAAHAEQAAEAARLIQRVESILAELADANAKLTRAYETRDYKAAGKLIGSIGRHDPDKGRALRRRLDDTLERIEALPDLADAALKKRDFAGAAALWNELAGLSADPTDAQARAADARRRLARRHRRRATAAVLVAVAIVACVTAAVYLRTRAHSRAVFAATQALCHEHHWESARDSLAGRVTSMPFASVWNAEERAIRGTIRTAIEQAKLGRADFAARIAEGDYPAAHTALDALEKLLPASEHTDLTSELSAEEHRWGPVMARARSALDARRWDDAIAAATEMLDDRQNHIGALAIRNQASGNADALADAIQSATTARQAGDFRTELAQLAAMLDLVASDEETKAGILVAAEALATKAVAASATCCAEGLLNDADAALNAADTSLKELPLTGDCAMLPSSARKSLADALKANADKRAAAVALVDKADKTEDVAASLRDAVAARKLDVDVAWPDALVASWRGGLDALEKEMPGLVLYVLEVIARQDALTQPEQQRKARLEAVLRTAERLVAIADARERKLDLAGALAVYRQADKTLAGYPALEAHVRRVQQAMASQQRLVENAGTHLAQRRIGLAEKSIAEALAVWREPKATELKKQAEGVRRRQSDFRATLTESLAAGLLAEAAEQLRELVATDTELDASAERKAVADACGERGAELAAEKRYARALVFTELALGAQPGHAAATTIVQARVGAVQALVRAGLNDQARQELSAALALYADYPSLTGTAPPPDDLLPLLAENAKTHWETAVAAAQKRVDLDTFGGEKWRSAKALAEKAAQATKADKPTDALKSYGAAAAALADLVLSAERASGQFQQQKRTAEAARDGWEAALKKSPGQGVLEKFGGAPWTQAKAARDGADAAMRARDYERAREHYAEATRKVTTATPRGKAEKEITYYRNSIGMEFVRIEAGEFMMGSGQTAAEVARLGSGKEEYYKDEHPQHKVRITKQFFMASTEVTQGQYKAVMAKEPAKFGGDKNPVEQVSWNDAQAFCKELSKRDGVTYRLPTEAEWEYACRAGTPPPFYTGGTISTEQANYAGISTYGDGRKGEYRQKTTAVASFPANPWGLHDMHGNVWEWCQDWHDEDYYKKSPAADPAGFATGSSRVLRGGSWNNNSWNCRSANRNRNAPSNSSTDDGIRVVVVVVVQ
jgi:formylglycine-generating enzyme required for sulfatase activity/serine/threonine protein kinase